MGRWPMILGTMSQLFVRRLLSTASPSVSKRRILPKILLAGGALSYGYYMYDNYRDAKEKEPATGVPASKVLYRLSFYLTD